MFRFYGAGAGWGDYMKYLARVFLAVCLLTAFAGWADAGCVVENPALDYSNGTNLRDDKCDPKGNKKVSLETLLAGEDTTNDVIKVEQRFLSSGTKTADAQIKASPGFVHTVTCYGTDNAAVAGTIILYDNTAESGTVLWSWTIGALDYHIPFTVHLDATAATGLYLGYTTTTDVNCTVSYR